MRQPLNEKKKNKEEFVNNQKYSRKKIYKFSTMMKNDFNHNFNLIINKIKQYT